jgi:hypothetical protein
MTKVRFSRGLRLLGALAIAVTATLTSAAPVLAQSACPAFVDPDLCIDDFNCYKSITTLDTPQFVPVSGVTLVDQFETATVRLQRPYHLCTPTNVNDEGTIDGETHLVSYVIRQQSPAHVKRTAIRVTNFLEEIRVDTIRPELLLVPTNKTLVLPAPPAPNPANHTVDHYKCYRVKVTAGTPKAAIDRKINVEDQFNATKIYSLKLPRHLCVPADKNGEGIKNPTVHLLCYRGKRARGEMNFVPRKGLFVNNQFGPLRLDALKENEFCIPSLKSLSPSGAFLDSSCD